MRLLAIGGLLVAGRAAADEPCPPSARLEGDAELVQQIQPRLTRRGVRTQSSKRCSAVKVTVGRAGEKLLISIEDRYGRKSERSVADAEAAATVIESWARSDLNAGLLAGWSYEPPAAPVVKPLPAQTVAAPAPAARGLASLAIAGETSLGFDGSLWLGAGLSGCLGLGRFCLGTSARLLAGTATSTSLGVDLLATVELPVKLGRAVLVPGLGLGGGWITIGQSTGQNNQEISNFGLRADVHASLSYPLGHGVSLHIGVAADVSAQAADAPQNQDMNQIPGEPSGYLRGLLGLRLGGP